MKTMRKWVYPTLLSMMAACGSAKGPQPSETKEPWNPQNDPSRFEVTTARLSDLPTEGQMPADRYPWSDTYWATRTGGVSYRWQIPQWDAQTYKDYQYPWVTRDQVIGQSLMTPLATLSPAEKYDILMGRYDFPLAKHERGRQESSVDPGTGDVPGWFGLCHGWAPASYMEPEPGPEVTVTNPDGVNLTFYTSDINALMTKIYADANTPSVSVGERCWDDSHEIRRDENGRILNTKCRDTNPGTLHLVLAKFLGQPAPEQRHGFVMDMTYDDEVWNQAVTGYKVTSLTREPWNRANDPAARYRAPGTVELAHVAVDISYITEIAPHKTPMMESRDSYTNTMYVSYTLELDANGTIIGGEWTSTMRPDFLWKLNAIPQTGNGYLSYQVVRDLLDRSREASQQ